MGKRNSDESSKPAVVEHFASELGASRKRARNVSELADSIAMTLVSLKAGVREEAAASSRQEKSSHSGDSLKGQLQSPSEAVSIVTVDDMARSGESTSFPRPTAAKGESHQRMPALSKPPPLPRSSFLASCPPMRLPQGKPLPPAPTLVSFMPSRK